MPMNMAFLYNYICCKNIITINYFVKDLLHMYKTLKGMKIKNLI